MMCKNKTIFIFAYYSFKDPVFQSAVLPYFKNLNDGKSNLRFVLLTFEQEKYRLGRAEIHSIKEELRSSRIIWFHSYWHSGRFKIIKKAFDFFWGIILSSFIILKYRVSAIYSEGFPGGIIAHELSFLFRIPHLIHTFEPHTDYMVESGIWKKNSWEARLLKRYEIRVAKGAEYIFTATEAMIEKLKLLSIKAKIYRVPSCVDTIVFNFVDSKRIELRKELGIKEGEIVVTYLGKLGGMYMEEEMVEFFSFLLTCSNECFKFFILTHEDHSKVFNLIDRYKLDRQKFFVKTLSRSEVPSYLSASDFGFCGIRAIPSRRFSSPIKNGEYWACGLPILIPDGISDDYLTAEESKIGIRIKDFSKESLIETLKKMEEWRKLYKKDDVVKRCADFVECDRSVEKYKQLYRSIFLNI